MVVKMQEQDPWSSLSDSDQQAARRAMEYWVQHWDWECPTLFGLEREDVVNAILTWPHSSAPAASQAVVGSLRELLYGASTPAKSELPRLIGMPYERAHELATAVHAIAESNPRGAQ